MIFWITFGIFIFCLTMESITSWRFIKGSKKKHPELWVHAGEPTLMGNGDLISAWPLTKYLLSRQYHQLENKVAVDFAEKSRLPFIVSYFSAGISAIICLASMLVFGVPE